MQIVLNREQAKKLLRVGDVAFEVAIDEMAGGKVVKLGVSATLALVHHGDFVLTADGEELSRLQSIAVNGAPETVPREDERTGG